MGIKGLNKLITRFSPLSTSTINIADLKGSKVAIDSEILLHKFRNFDNSKNSHIYGFINNINTFLKNGVLPIYVFDGVPNMAKQKNAILKRSQSKEFLNKKIVDLENEFIEKLGNKNSFEHIGDDINDILYKLMKSQSKVSNVTKSHRNECKYLLKLLGIPYIVAMEDAEALCVSLQFNGLVDYVYSDDTDVIPYFISCYINDEKIDKPINILRGKCNFGTLECLNITKILEDLELTPKEFVDLCILCGCDFCEGLYKVGPMNAYKHIKQHKNIENLETILEYNDSFKFREARDVFYKNHNLPISTVEICGPNYSDLHEYLQNERNIDPAPIIEKFEKIIEAYKKNQSNKHSELTIVSSGINNEICSL